MLTAPIFTTSTKTLPGTTSPTAIKMLLYLLLIQCVLGAQNKALSLEEAEKLTGTELVDYLKTHQTLFEVGETPASVEGMKHLMDSKYTKIPANVKRVKFESDEELPERFDARERWPRCKSITYIRDQSKCGSCWAVAAAEVMSDRLCVQSNGRKNVHLSDTDILACCGEPCGEGCEGGWPYKAWKFLQEYGVVTGGHYREKNVCLPYSFHPCGNKTGQPYYGECPSTRYPTPKCRHRCQYGYPFEYPQDKYYGRSAYYIENNEKMIRQAIMKDGPVGAAFDVYEDFRQYKGGIYKHTAGKQTGSHAVKILGWGKENGTDYWILANSWGVTFGEQGYFRMVRGENDCKIEEEITAGDLIV
ncbi:unnamed protein product [Cylicocyclus nassatus]|uniref:Peptidase C1A papain C-terminal domain-containing protein n=1 Tax=Cylicocyclus nassatus TaxID=53992 RepID=A0AA36GQH2_CYLNA|nr:unnamed protein product [Cylicocyclus nassatus]